jgi:hypothetical protein
MIGVADANKASATRDRKHLFDSCLAVAGILAGNDRSWDGVLRQPVDTILRLLTLFTAASDMETLDEVIAKAHIRKENTAHSNIRRSFWSGLTYIRCSFVPLTVMFIRSSEIDRRELALSKNRRKKQYFCFHKK